MPNPNDESNLERLFGSLSDTHVAHKKELRETFHHLALSSGALAAGALVLLSTNANVDSSLILIGVIILLFEVVLIFSFLLHNHVSSIIEVEIGMYDIVQPSLKITKEAKTFDEVLAAREKIMPYFDKIQKTKRRSRNIFELAVITLLGFGGFMLALGLLEFPLCSVWTICILASP